MDIKWLEEIERRIEAIIDEVSDVDKDEKLNKALSHLDEALSEIQMERLHTDEPTVINITSGKFVAVDISKDSDYGDDSGYCGTCRHCDGVDEEHDVCICRLDDPHKDWRYANEKCPKWEE